MKSTRAIQVVLAGSGERGTTRVFRVACRVNTHSNLRQDSPPPKKQYYQLLWVAHLIGPSFQVEHFERNEENKENHENKTSYYIRNLCYLRKKIVHLCPNKKGFMVIFFHENRKN